MKICPMCASQLSDEATFCPECGSALPDTQPTTSYTPVTPDTTVLGGNNSYSGGYQPQSVQPSDSPVVDNQLNIGGGYNPGPYAPNSGGGYNPGPYGPNSGGGYNPGPYGPVSAVGPGGNAKAKSFDKKYLIIGAAAIAAIIVVIVLIATLSSTPTRTANKYLKGCVNADGEQVLDTEYPDAEDYLKAYFDEDIEELAEDDGFDDAEEYFKYIEELAEEDGYDGSIENGSDVYDFCVWLTSEELEEGISDEDIADFNVTDVKQYKEGDDEYDDFIDYVEKLVDNYDSNDFDIEKYISPDDIKQYAIVEYELLDDDGDEVYKDELELELVKVGTKWYVFDSSPLSLF